MAECISPIRIKNDQGDLQPVQCGKCPNCMARKISGWSFRLMQEFKVSETSLFITLTYDTKFVPITERGFLTLTKRDVQLFFKRLRKNHYTNNMDGKAIKYYAVGEYGGKTNRPHYHIILFNAHLELIQESWNRGEVHYGLVNEASVGYTLKYVSKPSKIPINKNDDRQKEFSLMSKGLGSSYLTKAMVLWHKKDMDNRMYCNIQDGKKIAMPRYYKDKIYDEYERIMVNKAQLCRKLEEQALDIARYGHEEVYRRKLDKDLAAIKKYKYQNRIQTRSKI